MLSYFYQADYYDGKELILTEVIPNMELKIKQLKKIQGDKIENNTCLEKEIKKKEVIIKCLKYYFRI
jgi:hypothetical protein